MQQMCSEYHHTRGTLLNSAGCNYAETHVSKMVTFYDAGVAGSCQSDSQLCLEHIDPYCSQQGIQQGPADFIFFFNEKSYLNTSLETRKLEISNFQILHRKLNC